MSDLQRQLDLERAAYKFASEEVDRLHTENLNLRRTIAALRKALRRMIDAVEGDLMKNATQAAKDLL